MKHYGIFLVGVIISVHNDPASFFESVERILSHDHRNLEFIIINEGAPRLSVGISHIPLQKSIVLSFLWFPSPVAASLPRPYVYAAGHQKHNRNCPSKSASLLFKCLTNPA